MKSRSLVIFLHLAISYRVFSSQNNDYIGTIRNGGFEEDKDVVEPEGGIYSNLPTGWDAHKGTIMIDYSVRTDYVQQNSGSIFLSILGSRQGYVEQTIHACPGLKMTLIFTAASFSCQECAKTDFNVTVASQTILQVLQTPTVWTHYYTTFNAPADSFSLRFAPIHQTYSQLFLDNIELYGGVNPCAPSAAPTTHTPTHSPTSPSYYPTGMPHSSTPSLTPTIDTKTRSPSMEPTTEPTHIPTANPSTSFPTGTQLMLTVEGRINLKFMCFDDNLNKIDLYIIKHVISDIVHAGAQPVHGLTQVVQVDSARVDYDDVAVIFNVEILNGRYNASSFNFGIVVNHTRSFLDVATRTTDVFITKLSSYMADFNGTTLDLYSKSAVSIDYFRIGDGSHLLSEDVAKNKRKGFMLPMMISIIASVLGLTAMGLAIYICRKSVITDNDEAELNLLGAVEMAGALRQTTKFDESDHHKFVAIPPSPDAIIKKTKKQRNFEKIEVSSAHSTIPQQAP
eukprot:gene3885-7757_t